MELNILLRGQSNAYQLAHSSSWQGVATDVQRLLGFDGVTDTVKLVWNDSSADNDNTIRAGTAFVGDWVAPITGDWRQGWTNLSLEQGILNFIHELPADQRSDPTAIVWLHNEYDSTNANLTTDQWTSAVRFDAAQIRAALGQSAATTPYLFVPIPYGGGERDDIGQAIKIGMAQLEADPTFHAAPGAQANDVGMDAYQWGTYGGPHLNDSDAATINFRLARSLAENFAAYAKPGSAVATGQVDAYGPMAVRADITPGNVVVVTVSPDIAGLQGNLRGNAAAGVGWSIQDGGTALSAQWAYVMDATHIAVGFGSALPADVNARLHYGYGYGRLATGPTDPGKGTAIYDQQGMPVWTPATGLTLGGLAGSGLYYHQDLTTGAAQIVRGQVGPTGYDSAFVAITPQSVMVWAFSPNAALYGNAGNDILGVNEGNNVLDGGAGANYLAGGAGADLFLADTSVGPLWDVIGNFHPGDAVILSGVNTAAAALSWSDSGGATLTVTGGGVGFAAFTFNGVDLATARNFAIGGDASHLTIVG